VKQTNVQYTLKIFQQTSWKENLNELLDTQLGDLLEHLDASNKF